jgi:hypothetical protein
LNQRLRRLDAAFFHHTLSYLRPESRVERLLLDCMLAFDAITFRPLATEFVLSIAAFNAHIKPF